MLAISPAPNPATGIASSAQAAPTRADKDARAFCRRFPNAVAIDDRVTAALLVALAYRSTWTGATFGLNEVNLAKVVIGKGLGRNKIRRTVALGKHLGYLTREHNSKAKRVWKKGRKHFAKARDTLHLPGCSDNDGRIVWRQWFDGSFSVNELAAVLFIRAHGKTHARQLAERFGWSRPTAAKVIGARDAAGGDGLLGRGLLVKTTERKTDGTIKGITYEVPQLSAKRLVPAAEPDAVKTPTTVKTPCNGGQGNGQPCNGKAVDTRRVTPHVPLTGSQSLTHSEDPHHHLHAQHSQQASAGAPNTIFSDRVKTEDEVQKDLDRAHEDPALLGWSSSMPEEIRALAIDLRPIGLGLERFPDAELRHLLTAATAGRIHARILGKAGLMAVRALASANAEAASEVWLAEGCVHGCGFDNALCDLLNIIDDRVGKNPQIWLNSLKLIGPRFLEAVNEALQSGYIHAWPLLVYGEDQSDRFRTNKYGGHHEPDLLDTEDPVWLAKRAAFEALPWTAKQGGKQLPPDWTLPDDLRDWSLKLRPDLGLEGELDLAADAFRDYWHGRNGANSYKQDWRAAWRKHWRKAVAGYAASDPGCDAMDCEHDKDRAVANFLAGGEWDPLFGDPPERPIFASPDQKTRVA